jgi:uncharacterized membrane protein
MVLALRRRLSLGSPSFSGLFFALYVASMPIYCLIRLAGNNVWTAGATVFTCVVWFAFSLVHSTESKGLSRTLLMLGSGFLIALTFEYLGATTGFLFGEYHYTDLLGFKAFGVVPVVIPLAWFMMLYPAWETVRFLLQKVRFATLITIALSAFAMTAWDLSLDPRMVRDGAWVWPNGGFYFGIPLSNYVGWLVTSATIFAFWTVIDPRPIGSDRKPAALPVTLAIWAYIVTWLGESLANATFWGGPAIALIVFVAMGVVGAPALRLALRALLTPARS